MSKMWIRYILKNNIKKYRKQWNISQEKLAYYIGVSQNTISDLETYKCFPSAKLSGLIALYFGVSWDSMFYLEPSTNRLN